MNAEVNNDMQVAYAYDIDSINPSSEDPLTDLVDENIASFTPVIKDEYLVNEAKLEYQVPDEWTHEDIKKLLDLYEKNPEALEGWENQKLKVLLDDYKDIYHSKIAPNLQDQSKLAKINSILQEEKTSQELTRLAENYQAFEKQEIKRELATKQVELAKANEQLLTRQESEIIPTSENLDSRALDEWEQKTTAKYIKGQYQKSKEELKNFVQNPNAENAEKVLKQKQIVEESMNTIQNSSTLYDQTITSGANGKVVINSEEASQLRTEDKQEISQALNKDLNRRVEDFDEQLGRLRQLPQTEEVQARIENIEKSKEELQKIQDSEDYDKYLAWIKENSSEEDFQAFMKDIKDGSIDSRENKKLLTDALANKTEHFAEAVIELDNDIFADSTGYDSKVALYENNQAAFEQRLAPEKIAKLRTGHYDTNVAYNHSTRTAQLRASQRADFDSKVAAILNPDLNEDIRTNRENSIPLPLPPNILNQISAQTGIPISETAKLFAYYNKDLETLESLGASESVMNQAEEKIKGETLSLNERIEHDFFGLGFVS